MMVLLSGKAKAHQKRAIMRHTPQGGTEVNDRFSTFLTLHEREMAFV
jgi:hypothetical protein